MRTRARSSGLEPGRAAVLVTVILAALAAVAPATAASANRSATVPNVTAATPTADPATAASPDRAVDTQLESALSVPAAGAADTQVALVPSVPAAGAADTQVAPVPSVPAAGVVAQGASARATAVGVAAAYRVVAVPLRPASLNARDEVIGTTAGRRAAVWSERSGVKELPLPKGFEISEGISLNAAGQALALASDRPGTRHEAYTVYRGHITVLPGTNTRGYKITERGDVGGEAQLPGHAGTEPVLWVDGSLRPLGLCCGGAARDLNRRGEAIGDAYDAKGAFRAFVWTPGGGIHIIGPEGRYSDAIAVNELGHVLIQTFPGVFLYDGEKLVPLVLPGKRTVHPWALNGGEVVVGGFGLFSDVYRAFAWDAAQGFVDLNTRIAKDADWTLEQATAINEAGAMIGRGDHGDEEDAGFLLVPVVTHSGRLSWRN